METEQNEEFQHATQFAGNLKVLRKELRSYKIPSPKTKTKNNTHVKLSQSNGRTFHSLKSYLPVAETSIKLPKTALYVQF
jgi:hypothetical protein